jgi:GT2 family glycosyltransferase
VRLATGPAEVHAAAGERPSVTDVTVVIVTYNSAAHLPACADALSLALAGLATRVVVVDNHSTDGSAALGRRLWPAARVIDNATNRGFGPAANQGMAEAAGRAVLLLNPDALPAPDALHQLLDYLDADPAAGIVAPRLIDAAGRPVLSCYPFPTLSTLAWRYLHLHRIAPRAGGGRLFQATAGSTSTAPVRVPWAQGACLLLRAEMLKRIGGFDENFVMYAEEVDLARRAATAGWTCVYLPIATVRHQEGSSAMRVPRFKLVSHYFSALSYFETHHPRQVPFLKALFLVDLAIRWLARLPAVATGVPADAAERRAAYLLVARSLLADTPARRLERWRGLARTVRPQS